MSIICSFFGHRKVFNRIELPLHAEIERHITKLGVDTFYAGGYGEFDAMATGVLYNMKKIYTHISIYKILAYLPTIEYNSYSLENGETLYPEGLELVPRRFAIVHRNRWIVDNSDYVIAYVRNSSGGAFESIKYAKRNNKIIVNLADEN